MPVVPAVGAVYDRATFPSERKIEDLGTDSEFLFSATGLQLRNLERRCSGPEISIFLSIAVGSVQHENDLRVRTSRLRVVHPDFDFRVS